MSPRELQTCLITSPPIRNSLLILSFCWNDRFEGQRFVFLICVAWLLIYTTSTRWADIKGHQRRYAYLGLTLLEITSSQFETERPRKVSQGVILPLRSEAK